MYHSVAGYDVWFVMNAWEMAKLRRYYLHGGWDGAADVWETFGNPGKLASSEFRIPCSRLQCTPRISAARKIWLQRWRKYQRLRSICRGLTQIQHDFGKMIDAFVDFLLVVPPTNGEDALARLLKTRQYICSVSNVTRMVHTCTSKIHA